MSKAKLEREGRLPVVLEVTPIAAGLIDTRGNFENDPALDGIQPDDETVPNWMAERDAWSPMPQRLERRALLEEEQWRSES